MKIWLRPLPFALLGAYVLAKTGRAPVIMIASAENAMMHGPRARDGDDTFHAREVMQFCYQAQKAVSARPRVLRTAVLARRARHFQRKPLLGGHGKHCIAAAVRIDSASVRDDLDAPLLQFGQDARDHLDEIAGIAGLRIARLLLLQDGHGDLGQIVERQIVQRAPANLFDGGLKPISPEPLPVGDADHIWILPKPRPS